MPTYRVTVQEASVREFSYDIEARDANAAQEALESANDIEPVHTERISHHAEIVGVEEV